jgi:hypothetical protein
MGGKQITSLLLNEPSDREHAQLTSLHFYQITAVATPGQHGSWGCQFFKHLFDDVVSTLHDHNSALNHAHSRSLQQKDSIAVCWSMALMAPMA